MTDTNKQAKGKVTNEQSVEMLRAIETGDAEKVRRMLDAGFEQDYEFNGYKGWMNAGNILNVAASNGQTEIVRMLIETYKYDINKGDSRYGKTALHLASFKGQTTVVRELIKAGADVNIQDKDGKTALHRASWSGHATTVKELIKAGADVNIQDKDGNTALHDASRAGHTEVVSELIKSGVDVNMRNNKGNTALHFALNNGETEVVKELIKEGDLFMILDEIIKKKNPKPKPKTSKLSIRLHKTLHELFYDYCKKNNVTKAFVISNMVDYINDHPEIIEVFSQDGYDQYTIGQELEIKKLEELKKNCHKYNTTPSQVISRIIFKEIGGKNATK